MTKADGLRIVIEFNEQIFSTDTQVSEFDVTVPEYDYVPNGNLINVKKNISQVLIEPSIFKKVHVVTDLNTVYNTIKLKYKFHLQKSEEVV